MTPSADRLALKGPQQKRSRERRAALVEYGLTLFAERDLDEVSIAEITEALGYSTGSFYSYFPDKSAYFIEVQHWLNHIQEPVIAQTFETADMAQARLPERLEISVTFALHYFRTYTGVIRSALRYERRIPQAWAPNRATTHRIVTAACIGLDADQTERLQIALQLAFGMLVNALLHDPGPLRLDDPSMGPKILAALRPYLDAPSTDTFQSGRMT